MDTKTILLFGGGAVAVYLWWRNQTTQAQLRAAIEQRDRARAGGDPTRDRSDTGEYDEWDFARDLLKTGTDVFGTIWNDYGKPEKRNLGD